MMTAFQIFAVVWIPISLTLVVLFAFNVERIEAFIASRKRHRSAK